MITEVAAVSLDIDGHSEEQVFLYVVPKLVFYNMILKLPWMKNQNVHINAWQSKCLISFSHTLVWNSVQNDAPSLNCVHVSAAAFKTLILQKWKNIEVFAASMWNIEKALWKKTWTDSCTKLPSHYQDFLDVFSHEAADKLPSIQEVNIDHAIELEKKNDKDS